MKKASESIPKQPELKPAEDYYQLRREGIGFIAKMASSQWTDYNTHDPGITILEVLCYAITDLAYRANRDIKDLLAPEKPSADTNQPFPNQAFFTAREILTINPVTTNDFRRLLIDLDEIRNAWVLAKSYGCDIGYYAKCHNEQLQLSFQNTQESQKVEPKGLYDVLLELETDPDLGDLNDHKIEYTYSVFDTAGNPHPVILEIRFPDWSLTDAEKIALFPGDKEDSFDLTAHIGTSKACEPLSDPDFRNHWRNVFFVRFEILLKPDNKNIIIQDATLRIFGDISAKNKDTTPADIKAFLEDKTSAGFIRRYRNKLLKINQAVEVAKATLRKHRNLDEDFSRVSIVNIEDIAVCADVEVTTDADIEWVQAKIWFAIERYFNRPVLFYSLQELLDNDIAAEDIFNGPALNNGFISTEELQNAALKTVLQSSDIIKQLMSIEGVIAVNNLLLSKYDTEGKLLQTKLTPEVVDGKLTNTSSVPWILYVEEKHQPRLYRNLSRFLFFKNGLPFMPRMDEAKDTLTQLRGEAERPKIKNALMDLTIPSGTFRHPEDYYPLQYSFPLTYGIGPEGLPAQTSEHRKAQARQLKAYLMVFEQLMANALAQLAHTEQLFSLDLSLDRTYFVKELSKEIIQGYDDLLQDFDKTRLESITETSPEFHERRNRFLNHLMARFGEQFGEYALLLTNFQGQQVGLDRLIEDKISFLKAYPLISRDRNKAFNYKEIPCDPDNFSGLKKRIGLLLGYPDLGFFWTTSSDAKTVTHYQLEDKNKVSFIITQQSLSGLKTTSFPDSALQNLQDIKNREFPSREQFITELKKQLGIELTTKFETLLLQHSKNKKVIWREGELNISAADQATAKKNAYHKIITQMIQTKQSDAYEIIEKEGLFYLACKDKDKAKMEQYPKAFKTKAEANALYEELVGWSANERAIVIEHILLRPKFPGDALYPVCTDGTCSLCGDEDPYSFRLTFVMPGWTTPYNTNLEMRRFADRTIRQETPAHLLAKICWVDNTGFEPDPCGEPLLATITELLEEDLSTTYTRDEACNCAWTIFNKYSADFKLWFETRKTNNWLKTAWESEINNLFKDIGKTAFDCTRIVSMDTWGSIHTKLLIYFTDIALYGWQFERFEEAWCQWLEANAKIDWTEVRLQERVQAILESGLDSSPSQKDLCDCVVKIIGSYANEFHKLMQTGITGNNSVEALKQFVIDELLKLKIEDCNDWPLLQNTKDNLTELLVGKKTVDDIFVPGLYADWVEVSYRLGIVVNLLSQLRNTYPGATLHDCDDGSDQNPVRLGSTALGNYPLRSSAT